jgi:hypothetical protein
LDDAIFGGMHVIRDLSDWVRSTAAPAVALVKIVVMAYYCQGKDYANRMIDGVARQSEKTINLEFWRVLALENRSGGDLDTLAPTSLPNDPRVDAYVDMLKNGGHPPELRKPGTLGQNKVFSSDEGRSALEENLLLKGLEIREISQYLNQYMRPLGNHVLYTLGFGATVVTFRNCPNNCPLAFWAAEYPLFPRENN